MIFGVFLILFRTEYEGNYSPSAGQLDGGKQCPDSAQSVQMSSAQLTKIASKVLLTHHEKPAWL